MHGSARDCLPLHCMQADWQHCRKREQVCAFTFASNSSACKEWHVSDSHVVGKTSMDGTEATVFVQSVRVYNDCRSCNRHLSLLATMLRPDSMQRMAHACML